MDFNLSRYQVGFHRRVLPNGLVVIVLPHKETALAAINVLYRTGSRDEDPEQTGLAHLMEHLMFSGTERFPAYDLPIARVGGVNNAFTNQDITNFYIVMPVEFLSLGLEMEADRMGHLVTDLQKVQIQKGVVVEEFRQRYLNQPYGDLNHLLASAAYKSHPYRWPTIGLEPSHIETVTADQVTAFYQAHYSPDRAILAVSGDVDPEMVFQQAAHWFGNLPCRPNVVRHREAEPLHNRANRVEVRRNVPSSYLLVAYPVPESTHRDFTGLTFLADILGQGIISHLHRELVNRHKMLSRVHASLTGTAEPGLFVVSGMLLNGIPSDKATEAIQETIHQFIHQGPTPSEMRSVVNGAFTQTLMKQQSVMNLAMEAAYAEFEGDVSRINTQLDAIARMNSDTIAALAERYLVRDNRIEVHYLKES